MKKLLLIILIGIFIMLKPINAIIKDSIGNIIHRGNVVTGIVEIDNGDGSYDVFISESDRAYPKIFTLSADPNLAAGDKVRILYKDGCKELPIILPPMAKRYHAFVLECGKNIGAGWHDYLSLYDLDGNLIREIIIDYAFGTYDQLTMDKWGNIYDGQGGKKIRKYDKNLNLLFTKVRENASDWIYSINMGPDGYLYSLEIGDTDMHLYKRSTIDLSVVDTCILDATGWVYWDGLCITSDGHFYSINTGLGPKEDYLQKIRFSDGAVIVEKFLDALSTVCAGMGIIENILYQGGDGLAKIGGVRIEGLYVNKDLIGNFNLWNPDGAINYRLTVVDGTHIICSGWDAHPANDSVIAKYDSGRNLIWKIVIAGGGGNPFSIGSYNFSD